MERPFDYPTPREVLLLDMIFSLQQDLNFLASSVKQALPQAAIPTASSGGFGHLRHNFSLLSGFMGQPANPSYMGMIPQLSQRAGHQLTNEALLKGFGPKVSARLREARTPPELMEILNSIQPIHGKHPGEQLNLDLADPFFDKRPHTRHYDEAGELRWPISERQLQSRPTLKLWDNVYDFFAALHRQALPKVVSESDRVALYNVPRSQADVFAFRDEKGVISVLYPTGQYSEEVDGSISPVVPRYLAFSFDFESMYEVKVWSAFWFAPEECWLEQGLVGFIPTDEVQQGVEWFLHQVRVAPYPRVSKLDVGLALDKVLDWGLARRRAIEEAVRYSNKESPYSGFSWEETIEFEGLRMRQTKSYYDPFDFELYEIDGEPEDLKHSFPVYNSHQGDNDSANFWLDSNKVVAHPRLWATIQHKAEALFAALQAGTATRTFLLWHDREDEDRDHAITDHTVIPDVLPPEPVVEPNTSTATPTDE